MLPVRACLSGTLTHQEIILEAYNRRGKLISCQTTITPLLSPESVVCGVILLMEQQPSPLDGDDG